MELTKKRISKIINNKKQSRHRNKERKYKKNRYSVGNKKYIDLKKKTLKFRKSKGGAPPGYIRAPEVLKSKGRIQETIPEEKEELENNEYETLKRSYDDARDNFKKLNKSKISTDEQIKTLEHEIETANQELNSTKSINANEREIEAIENKIQNKKRDLDLMKETLSYTNANIKRIEQLLNDDKDRLENMGDKPETEEIVVPTEEKGVVLSEEEVVVPTQEEEVVVPTQEEEVVVPTQEEEVVPAEEEEVVPAEEEEVVPAEEEEVVPAEEEVVSTDEEVVVPTEEEKTDKKDENVYTTMTTEEDDKYKMIKVIIKIPKKSNINIINNAGETALAKLQNLV